VGEDVALRAGARVGVEGVAQPRADERPCAAVEGARQGVAVLRQQGEQGGRVGRIPQPVDPGFGEADVAARQHGVEDVPVGNVHGSLARPRAEALPKPARQSQFQRPAAQAFEQAQH
jgi:hypothetical protein